MLASNAFWFACEASELQADYQIDLIQVKKFEGKKIGLEDAARSHDLLAVCTRPPHLASRMAGVVATEGCSGDTAAMAGLYILV